MCMLLILWPAVYHPALRILNKESPKCEIDCLVLCGTGAFTRDPGLIGVILEVDFVVCQNYRWYDVVFLNFVSLCLMFVTSSNIVLIRMLLMFVKKESSYTCVRLVARLQNTQICKECWPFEIYGDDINSNERN